MATTALKKIARQMGWQEEKHYIWGCFDNYLFCLKQGQGFKQIETLCAGLRADLEAIRQELLLEKKELRISAILIEGDLLILRCQERFKAMGQDALIAILTKVSATLKENGIGGRDTCSQCGGTENISTAYVNDFPRSICDACYGSLEAEFLEAERQREQTDKHYLQGSLGALLGALVGAIPWTIVAYLGYLAAILGFLIGQAALFGYKAFGGIVGRGTKWIVILATVISLVLAEIVLLGIAIVQNDLPLTLTTFIALLSFPEVLSSALADLGISLLLAAVGLYPLFTKIKSEEKAPRIERAQA